MEMADTRVHDRVVLDGNADAVEFCPHNSSLLAAATYTLHQLPQPHRVGTIALFRVLRRADRDRLSLQQLHQVETCGVFDMKWKPTRGGDPPTAAAFLAQAGSDGGVVLYRLNEGGEHKGMELEQASRTHLSSSMCLFIDWCPFHVNSDCKIIASHSDGCLTTVQLGRGGLELVKSWQAHELEAWTTAFDCWKPNVVYSGADDCHFCAWDLREDLDSPVYCNKKAHRMGVCCIQTNPLCEHELVTGSYDETVRIWDSRMFYKPILQMELGLGGGVWRVKWHPYHGGLLLAACMHNGFSVLLAKGSKLRVLEEYKGHDSLAYGADWYKGKTGSFMEVDNHQNREQVQVGGKPQAGTTSAERCCPSLIATCSFYDSALHLWEI